MTRIGGLHELPRGVGSSGGVVVTRGIRTAGNVDPVPNTLGAWQALAGFTFPVPAVVGDNLEFSPSFMTDPGTSMFVDLAVLVSGALVRYGSTRTATPATEGDPALYASPNTYRTSGAVFDFTVAAGDLDGGNVVFTVAVKAAGTGKLFSSVAYPFRWTCKNYGS